MEGMPKFQPVPRNEVSRSVVQPRRVAKGAVAGKGCQKYSSWASEAATLSSGAAMLLFVPLSFPSLLPGPFSLCPLLGRRSTLAASHCGRVKISSLQAQMVPHTPIRPVAYARASLPSEVVCMRRTLK